MIKIPAITREGMIEVDRIMTQDLGIEVPLMMEHAGLNLAKITSTYYERLNLKKIIVVAGSGNNGGGGMVAARRLKNWGFEVSLVLPKGMPSQPIPQIQLERSQECGVKILYQLPNINLSESLVVDDISGDGIDDITGDIALTYGNFSDLYFNTSLMIQFKVLGIQKPEQTQPNINEPTQQCI